MTPMKTALLLIALSLAVAGCGIKGDPVGPTAAAQKQQSQQSQQTQQSQ